MKRIEQLLTEAVARKLGAAVFFDRWISKPTGDVPVFKVPEHLREKASELGLQTA